MAIAGASTPQWAVTWLLDRMPDDATVVLKLGARGRGGAPPRRRRPGA